MGGPEKEAASRRRLSSWPRAEHHDFLGSAFELAPGDGQYPRALLAITPAHYLHLTTLHRPDSFV